MTIFDDAVDPSTGPIAGLKPVQTQLLASQFTGRDEHGKPLFGSAVVLRPVIVVKKLERFKKTDGDEVVRNGVVYAPRAPVLDLTWQFDLNDGFGMRKIIHIDIVPDEGLDDCQMVSFY